MTKKNSLLLVAGIALVAFLVWDKNLPGQCLPGEKYDSKEGVCYIECDTDEECVEIEKKIAQIAEDIGDDYFKDEKDYLEPQEPEEDVIAAYTVKKDALLPEVKDRRHQELWNYFVKLIPAQYRDDVVGFDIFTDGKEGTYAAVYQDDKNPLKWRLALDIDDAYDGEKLNDKDLIYSLIHEQGHLLTLNTKQVDLNNEIARAGDEYSAEILIKEAGQKCQPQYFTGEGCSKKDSYINIFFQRFWKDIYGQWQQLQAKKFYEKHRQQFITEYATTNPSEDISESWTAFVLKDKPEGQSVTDAKVLIFYDYSELKVLREAIRNRFINLFFATQ